MKKTVTMEKVVPAEIIVAVIDTRLKEGKIPAIKELRAAMPEISLRAAKDFVDAFDATCIATYCVPSVGSSFDPLEELGKILRGAPR